MPVLESENLHRKTRKRGPKPGNLRAEFAATAWLDGDLLWREGRAVWRVENRILTIGPRELDAVSRALSSLGRNEKAARRLETNFDSWHARRLAQWQHACLLAAIRAPDLETLTSPSRRRNPAALERLALLLAVEASVAKPLPVSPARALFAAFSATQPDLQRALQVVMRDEKQPMRARALAALAIGAARPFDALPGQPFLRRAARYGARFGFPISPELCVALLENDSNAEAAVRYLQNLLEDRARFRSLKSALSPLGFDAPQLLNLQRAGRDAESLAVLAQAASQLADPFPSFGFARVAAKRFDVGAERAISAAYNELRFASHASLREVLTDIARRASASDLAAVSGLLHFLISAPIKVLGALKVQKSRAPQKERGTPPFREGIEGAVAVSLDILRAVAASPEPGPLLQLLHEAAKNSAICPTNICPDSNYPDSNYPDSEGLSPAMWASHFRVAARTSQQEIFAPLLKLAQKFGVAATREAVKLGCWRELLRHVALPTELVGLALEIAAFAPASASDVLARFRQCGHFWNGEAGARAAWTPLTNALAPLSPEERALWLIEICDYSEVSRRGAHLELPALAAFLPAMFCARRQSANLEQRAKTKANSESATTENPATANDIAANAILAEAVTAGAVLSDDNILPRWVLVDTALALLRAAPNNAPNAALNNAESAGKRFDWLSGEMARRWSASQSKPGWGDLNELAAHFSLLAGEDDAKFRAFMAPCWRYAGWNNDFEWPDVRRGAKLARQFALFQAMLIENFARCPARCFALLEKLGPLERFDSIRAPLERWRERKVEVLSAEWRSLGLGAEPESWAIRFISAQKELGEPASPPPSVLKIAAWPQKMKAEIAALRNRGELPPNLSTRLQNLVARVENEAELRASMRHEMGETLQNATLESELRAAERCIENCYRTRLESLGAPKNLVLDADWLNAALFSTDLESGRKWLREIVRARPEKDAQNGDWRLESAGNARWLREMSERGLHLQNWLAEAPQKFDIGENSIELRLESGPLQILQMGNYFDTCLSRGGCNAPSSVANAVELNKRVVFARDGKNRVVGRQLLAVSGEGKLLGFRVYNSMREENASLLREAFGQYARDFAARCGLERGDEGEIERLFVADWWNDGAISWSDLDPAPPEAKSKSARKKS